MNTDLLWNQEMANKLIPESMHGGLRRWICQGTPPGGFLMAVLSNNLKEAVGRADSNNIHRIPDFVLFLYNYVPGACWGSEEKVAKWQEKFLEH